MRLIPNGHDLRFEGDLTLQTVASLEAAIAEWMRACPGAALRVDPGGIARLDTAGAILLHRLPHLAQEQGKDLELLPLPPGLQRFLEYVRIPPRGDETSSAPRVRLVDRLGNRAERDVRSTFTFLLLMSDLTWSAAVALFRRTGMRRDSFIEQAILVGSQGLPIIALILFLIGGVSTLQAAAQMRQFGANIYVADLLAIGITRELGPLMTAIVVSGRSGSAIAAEIATMKFTEEIDALHTMGLDPLRMVAVPKLWAMILTLPLLTTCADFVGLIGGGLVGVFSLDLSPTTFVTRLSDALILKDILTGLIKSLSFGWIITIIAVYHGLGFKGGAAGVGQATTAAVVSALFGIIVLDLAWGLIFYL